MLQIFDREHRPDLWKLLPVYSESILLSARRSNDTRSEYEKIIRAEDDFLNYIRDEFYRTYGAYIAVWSHNDQYVSAIRVEPFGDGYLLSGFETAPAERAVGYGTRLLQAVVCHLRESGVSTLYSHVHRNNAASLHIHKKCGFVSVSDSAVLLDGTVSTAYYTLKNELHSAL